MLIKKKEIEKDKIKVPQRAAEVELGIKDKNAITKTAMAIAKIKDIPLEPVSIAILSRTCILLP